MPCTISDDGTPDSPTARACGDEPAAAVGARKRTAPQVDVGSWSRFIPSLTQLLQSANLIDIVVVELTLAAPIVTADTVVRIRTGTGPLRALRRRRRPEPSPVPPRIMAFGLPDEVTFTVPMLDEQRRALLTEDASTTLTGLGWEQEPTRLLYRMPKPQAQQAVAMASRALIEVFDVAHPADLAVRVL